jgi:hypothetical protein
MEPLLPLLVVGGSIMGVHHLLIHTTHPPEASQCTVVPHPPLPLALVAVTCTTPPASTAQPLHKSTFVGSLPGVTTTGETLGTTVGDLLSTGRLPGVVRTVKGPMGVEVGVVGVAGEGVEVEVEVVGAVPVVA